MPAEEHTPMDNAERRPKRLSRRDFLRYAGLGLGLIASGGIATVLTGCAPPSSGSKTTKASTSIIATTWNTRTWA